ncbi:MAG: hypothetical protein C0467_09040 [Planctomycetaceae bacterium]|nr:hypothetical protein [Planctomycetaceae bacterium]
MVAGVLNHIAMTVKTSVPYVKNKVRTGHVRNRRVAKLARALRVGDAQQARGMLSSPLPATFEGAPQHVLVLVQSLKQAHALGKFLPTWPVVSGLGDDERTLKDDESTPLVASSQLRFGWRTWWATSSTWSSAPTPAMGCPHFRRAGWQHRSSPQENYFSSMYRTPVTTWLGCGHGSGGEY